MVIVAGFWELGWNTPIKEYDLWHFPMLDFGVQEIAMIPVSGIAKSNIKEFKELDSLLEYYNECTPVICSEEGEIDLTDFEHPTNALYIFGNTNYSPFNRFANEKNVKSVRFSTPTGKSTIWGHQAASIVLYDRYLKDGINRSR